MSAPATSPTPRPPVDQRTRSDAERITDVLRAIRAAFPTAHAVRLSSSDQGQSGYVLEAIACHPAAVPVAEGGEQVDSGPVFDQLCEDTDHDLSWLLWGAFGDLDNESTFVVDLTTLRIART